MGRRPRIPSREDKAGAAVWLRPAVGSGFGLVAQLVRARA